MEYYEKEYFEKLATADSMIYDRFRKKESLNGHWHYAVDQYDTFIRQKWFEENYYDGGENTLPVDFSFDEWELMTLPFCWDATDKIYMLYDVSMIFTRKFLYAKQNNDERHPVRPEAVNDKWLDRCDFHGGTYLAFRVS